MENKKYPKTDAKRREVQCYPPEKYLTLVLGYAHEQDKTRSKAALDMIQCFFDNMPADQRMRYLMAGKEALKNRPSQNRY
jgi:hypothetical protein